MSDALLEGRVNDLPEGLRPLVAAEADAETASETADAMVEAAMGSDDETAPEAAGGDAATDPDSTTA